MLYRINNNLVDINPSIYLQASDRLWGQARFYQHRTDYPDDRNLFFPRTNREWNALPSMVTEATTIEGFRPLLSSAQTIPVTKDQPMYSSFTTAFNM